MTRASLGLALLAPLAPGQAPSAGGPWDNDVHVYRLWPDGSADRLAVFERAGVATLARLADRRLIAAHQWFPELDPVAFDTIAVRFSDDEGLTWTEPRTIELEGLPVGYRFPFDPTLLPLPDGRVRLYFTLNAGRTFQDATPFIGSAISEDGVRYALEPGPRLAIPGEVVIDCAAALRDGIFHLYSPVQGSGPTGAAYHAVSRDGSRFERRPNVALPGVSWLGAAVAASDGLRFYGSGAGGLWMAASPDGQTWSPPSFFRLPGADPGVVEEPDGSRLIVVTGPPPSGATGRRRWQGAEKRPFASRRPIIDSVRGL